MKGVVSYFPRLIEDEVYYCGFSSALSYGASSYFVRSPEGNWLIDAPRFIPHLVDRFEDWGGIRYVFLTHRDDVGEAGRYAERFGSRRIIHEGDRDAVPGAEIVIRGHSPEALVTGFVVIPVPGHTPGHCALLYRDKFLFTGDHLYGDPERGALGAYRDYCWHDWAQQTRSVERLRDYRFEWVLPGHGRRLNLQADKMRAELSDLAERMKSQ